MAAFVRYLNRRSIDHRLITDCHSLSKLRLLGFNPDIVFDVSPGMSSSAIYKEVEQRLRQIHYDHMVSFGWRTYVPYNAIVRDKPAVIIDGGWPRILADMPSPFCKDVYKELRAYCLTNYFFDKRLNNLLPTSCGIPFTWIAQPFDQEEISWLKALGEEREASGALASESTRPMIFLDMNPEYIDPRQGTFTGGWLTPRQLDECRGFVTRLIVELEREKSEPLCLIIHELIGKQLGPVVTKCKTLKVVCHQALSSGDHHRMRVSADLVLLRAARCVGAAQAAFSRLPALHVICPAADDYMGEAYSCEIAKDLGIAQAIDHEESSLRDGIMKFLYSQELIDTASRAQAVALQAHRGLGPDYILSLLGLTRLVSANSLNQSP